ncbi:fatty acyl-CoA reductase 1 [Apis mellifera carnica]|nr:fatty acyl-CoA reductase 1 [Apis mellifera carnica]
MIKLKNNVLIKEQLKKYFQNEIFNTLHKTNPNFIEKIVPIYGDLSKADLGLSSEDRRCLVENVNIIIHNGSIVQSKKVSYTLRINVIATQKLLELAMECSHLEAFVYVSTTFSHPYKQIIEEKFYPIAADIKIIEDVIRADEENKSGITNAALRDIITDWVNLYSFSKAYAEDLVYNFGKTKSLPCVVFRPSMVACTNEKLIQSKNKNGPLMLTKAISLGYIHVSNLKKTDTMDLIPIDMTVNSLLAMIWDFVVYRKKEEPEVYNYGSTDWNPITVGSASEMIFKEIEKNPSDNILWKPYLIYVQNIYLFSILNILLNVIPGISIDLILLITKAEQPPIMRTIYKLKKHYLPFIQIFRPNQIIKTNKFKECLTRMNTTDLKEFSFNLATVNWNDSVVKLMTCCRKEMNEPITASPATKEKYRNLVKLHFIIYSLLILFLLYFFYRILSIF